MSCYEFNSVIGFQREISAYKEYLDQEGHPVSST